MPTLCALSSCYANTNENYWIFIEGVWILMKEYIASLRNTVPGGLISRTLIKICPNPFS